MFDRVVEIDGSGGAKPQQVARRKHADQHAAVVADGEVADFQPIHAADRPISESGGADAYQRSRCEVSDRHVKSPLGVGRYAAQQVTLGNDAIRLDRLIRRSALGHEDRADLALDHEVDDLPCRFGRLHHHWRAAHQAADAMAIGIGINRLKRRSLGSRHRLGPAGAMAGFESVRKGKAGDLGLSKCSDVALAQLRNQRGKDVSGRNRIAQSRMAAGYLQAKPSGDRFQRIVCQIGICYGCKKPDAQRPRLFPGQTGASAFALQYRQVESDRVADEDAVADELLELRPCIREAAGSVNIGIGDAVDERSLGRDCFTGIDEQIELSFAGRPCHARCRSRQSGPRVPWWRRARLFRCRRRQPQLLSAVWRRSPASIPSPSAWPIAFLCRMSCRDSACLRQRLSMPERFDPACPAT